MIFTGGTLWRRERGPKPDIDHARAGRRSPFPTRCRVPRSPISSSRAQYVCHYPPGQRLGVGADLVGRPFGVVVHLDDDVPPADQEIGRGFLPVPEGPAPRLVAEARDRPGPLFVADRYVLVGDRKGVMRLVGAAGVRGAAFQLEVEFERGPVLAGEPAPRGDGVARCPLVSASAVGHIRPGLGGCGSASRTTSKRPLACEPCHRRHRTRARG